MPRGSSTGAADVLSSAQGRFNVQLPADVRPMLDDLNRAQQEAIVAAGGLPMDISLAGIVTGAIKQAHAEYLKRKAEVEANGSGDGATVKEPETVPATS